MEEMICAISWIAQQLRESTGLDEGQCTGLAGILSGLQEKMESYRELK